MTSLFLLQFTLASLVRVTLFAVMRAIVIVLVDVLAFPPVLMCKSGHDYQKNDAQKCGDNGYHHENRLPVPDT